MGKLERITVTLPEEMAGKLRAAVDSGEYATTSEIVREALREWNGNQEHRHAALERLRKMVDEASKGPFLDGPEVMATLRERVVREAKKRAAL
jgi:antitoxin ParD1/3/4